MVKLVPKWNFEIQTYLPRWLGVKKGFERPKIWPQKRPGQELSRQSVTRHPGEYGFLLEKIAQNSRKRHVKVTWLLLWRTVSLQCLPVMMKLFLATYFYGYLFYTSNLWYDCFQSVYDSVDFFGLLIVAYFILKMINFMRCINLPICMVYKCVLFKD